MLIYEPIDTPIGLSLPGRGFFGEDVVTSNKIGVDSIIYNLINAFEKARVVRNNKKSGV